jgi:hypothetical protein
LLPPLLLLVALLAAASTELVSSAATAEYNPTKCSACEAVAVSFSKPRRRGDDAGQSGTPTLAESFRRLTPTPAPPNPPTQKTNNSLSSAAASMPRAAPPL